MRKKVKKVIKGLEKASKTHAKQATILKSGLKYIVTGWMHFPTDE